MSNMVFTCPACKKALLIEEEAADSKIACPLCTAEIRVPEIKTAIFKRKARVPARSVTRFKDDPGRLLRDVDQLDTALQGVKIQMREQMDGLDRLGKTAASMGQSLRGLCPPPRHVNEPPNPAPPAVPPPPSPWRWAFFAGLLALSLLFAMLAAFFPAS